MMRRQPNQLLYITVTALLLATLWACCKEEDSPTVVENQDYGMNLDSIREGDEFRFALYQGENGYDFSNDKFEYLGDTLILDVVERSGDTLRVQEYFAPGSISVTSDTGSFSQWSHRVLTNEWIIYDGVWIMSNSDFESFIIRNRRLEFPFNRNELEEVGMAGWKIDRHSAAVEEIFRLSSLDLLGETYDDLFVYRDHRDVSLDGPTKDYIYSKEHGLVKTISINFWTPDGWGWDRIPQ